MIEKRKFDPLKFHPRTGFMFRSPMGEKYLILSRLFTFKLVITKFDGGIWFYFRNFIEVKTWTLFSSQKWNWNKKGRKRAWEEKLCVDRKEGKNWIYWKSFHLSLTFFQVLLYGLWQIKNSYYSAIKPKSAHYHLLSLFSVWPTKPSTLWDLK